MAASTRKGIPVTPRMHGPQHWTRLLDHFWAEVVYMLGRLAMHDLLRQRHARHALQACQHRPGAEAAGGHLQGDRVPRQLIALLEPLVDARTRIDRPLARGWGAAPGMQQLM